MILHNQEPVRAAIWYALDNYQYQDATFLSERLHAEINTMETRYLLATCYYRAGHKREAMHLLKSDGELRDVQSRLLYARCCLDVKEYKTGLMILNGLLCVSDNNEQEIVNQYGHDAGLAFWLLGEMNRQCHMFDEAAKHYRSSLKYNPYLWSSFEALCHLGENVSPEEYFVADKCPRFQRHHISTTVETAPVAEVVAEKTITETNSNSLVCEHTSLDTPELYANPALGCAQASSTPDPRGQAPQKDEKMGIISDPSPLSQTLWGSVNSLSTAPGNLLPTSLSSVRTMLHFGSGRSGVAAMTSSSGKKASLQSSGSLTPLNPSFGMFTAPGTSHSITPTSTIKLAEFSDMEQSAYTSTSSAIISTSRKKQIIPSIARVAYSSGAQGRAMSRVAGSVSTENMRCSDVATLYLSPRDECDPAAMSSDGGLVSAGVDDDSKCVENMQPSHASSKTELATPRRSARLSVAKQQSRLQEVKGKSRAQSIRTAATERIKKVSKGGSSSQGIRKSVSPRRSSHPLTLGNKQNIQRGRAILATPTQREEQNMEIGGDIKKVKLISEELSVYSSSISSLMKLMVDLGMAYKALSRYELCQCLELFSSLPPHQMNTPWVFTQLARAHFEQGNYNEAVRLYQLVQSTDPYRFQGMEYYSASLWHLEKATELSVLADDLRHADTLRPETWCVMGNLMSLSKDHEAAIKLIERAIQVCPQFVYAYQLLSHEYIITENYDKALQVLRTAVSIDPRSCDSWFVMGVIYYLQEKYRFAEHHIKKAIAINKCSSLMYSQLGMVHCASGAYDEALQCLDKAVKLDPSKVLPRFDRTRVLQKAGHLQDALTELEELARRVPKEAQIYLQMGKIYQQLGQSHEAVMKFSWAQSLDGGRSGGQIKQEIDRTFQQWPRQGMAEEFDCYAEADSFNTTNNSDAIDHEDPMEN